eukprot:scaffold39862_cov66-Phaeocystis_antarctica.AAC.3
MLPGRARLCVLSKLLHPTASQPTTTPATSAARDADYLLDDNYLFGQNMTEHNPAPSRSGHPLLSGPPTLTDIHQYSPFGGASSEVRRCKIYLSLSIYLSMVRGLSLFGGASSEVRRCNCSVVDESCSSLAGLDARCVSFYRAIYLSIWYE